MVKDTLFIKSLRDMKKSLAQFISIFLMAMIAVFMLTGLDSIWKTMEIRSGELYKTTNMPDLWVTASNISDRDLWKVERIAGVGAVERRMVMNCDLDLPGEPTLKVYAMNRGYSIGIPYKMYGSQITNRGAVLDQSFADANNLKVGDKIRIKVNDIWIQYTIEELAISGEHIFSIKDSSTLIPDAKTYGFLMVDMDTITKAWAGSEVYNQLVISLTDSGNENEIWDQLEAIFGDRLRGVVNRQGHNSIENVQTKLYLFKVLSVIFPAMFFLVTALITLSTMARLVENQRNQIGVLKAMGYGKRVIMWHYTSYGIYVGILGTLVGLVLGPNVIGRILVGLLKVLYVFPSYDLKLNWVNIILSSFLIVACTGGISCYSSIKLLEEVPAELLRTKPPKKGIHIMLERFTGIWDNMKFSAKLVARNISKNKPRIAMSILGVAGCSSLIIGALSLRSMISGLSEKTFGEVYTYDQRLSLDSGVSHRFVKNLNLDGEYQDMQETSVQVTTETGFKKMVTLTVLLEENPLIQLKDLKKNPVFMPSEGLVITRKLAEILGVGVGDVLAVKIPEKETRSVEIKAIVSLSTGQGIYIRNDYWEHLGGNYDPSALLVKWNKNPNQALLNSSKVTHAIQREQQKQDLESNTQMVNSVALILIIAGSSLTFVVIYNMSILNFYERVRDLATLKVLGFFEREIRYLVLFENLVSTIAGIIIGIPFGKVIVSIFAANFGNDFDLDGTLKPLNVLLAGVLTMLFMAAVNRMVAKKMSQIDMLEALKSVE